MTAPAQLARARHLAQLGRITAALDAVRSVLASEPHHVFALLLLAYCHQQAGQPVEMLDAADRAAAAAPGNPAAHRSRSVALRKLGRYAEALAAADQARSLAPDDAEAEIMRAYALLAIGGTRAVLAAAASTARARQLAPHDVDVHRAEGNAQRRMAEFGRARAAYERALAIAPGDPRTMRALAALDADRGRALRAAPTLGAALSASPNDPATLRTSILAARRMLWLLTDVACLLQILVTIAVAGLLENLDGWAGTTSAAAVLVAGTLGVTLFLRWRLGRLPHATRTLLRTYRSQLNFVTGPLRVVSLAAAGLLMLVGGHLPTALEAIGSALAGWPLLLLLLRARNWFFGEVYYLARRCWFRLHPRPDPGVSPGIGLDGRP
ncbi:hypothetical protein GCM10027280_01560 [Micromonospora polyrhachis]|uniref:Tetratricopeptide (TPR) repeat protein n=1 Tax=Micromonospora polyrhachis TaxID=1282883 RepID=A0A7W7SNN7_9ACTN|nr:tetratricopeptide repeat protein [Micromonospora polyrhachis]MBB4957552.1 tetratricopeptide (TPR) repeat protein [Micromonospora polyrhachis]